MDLRDETTGSTHQHLLEFAHIAKMKKLLPDLSKNVVCGNSLVGLNLIAKLRARLGMESLPAHLLYEAPTIAALAQALRGDGRRAAQLDERERHGARRRATQIMRRKGN